MFAAPLSSLTLLLTLLLTLPPTILLTLLLGIQVALLFAAPLSTLVMNGGPAAAPGVHSVYLLY